MRPKGDRLGHKLMICKIALKQNHVQSRQREVRNEGLTWYDMILYDVMWVEVFTDVGVHVVVFTDVAPCVYVGVLTAFLRSTVPQSSESILFGISVTLCSFDKLFLKS
jgi:hypothetical protein